MRWTGRENDGQPLENTEAAPHCFEACWTDNSRAISVLPAQVHFVFFIFMLIKQKTDGQVTKIHLVFFPISGTHLLKPV